MKTFPRSIICAVVVVFTLVIPAYSVGLSAREVVKYNNNPINHPLSRILRGSSSTDEMSAIGFPGHIQQQTPTCPRILKGPMSLFTRAAIQMRFLTQWLRPDSEARMYQRSYSEFNILMNMGVSKVKAQHLAHGNWTPRDIPLPQSSDGVPTSNHMGLMNMALKDTDDPDDSIESMLSACAKKVAFELPVDDKLQEDNTWETVLATSCPPNMKGNCKEIDICRKSWEKGAAQEDFVPPPSIDLRTLFYKDSIWQDTAEHWIAFGSSPQAHWTKKLASPTTFGGAYVLEGSWWNFEPRKGLSRLGADMFFDASGKPIAIQTGDGLVTRDEGATWQQTKFLWRTTIAELNDLSHVWHAHIQWGNTIASATRSGLQADHPLRRLLTPFTFGTIAVNKRAVLTLMPAGSIFHRAVNTASEAVPLMHDTARQHILAVSRVMGPILDDGLFSGDPLMSNIPFFVDGRVLMTQAISPFVNSYVDVVGWCDSGTIQDSGIPLFFNEARYFAANKDQFDADLLWLEVYDQHGAFRCEGLKKFLKTTIFMVTAYHQHVGNIANDHCIPDFMGNAYVRGERARPLQTLLVNSIAVTVTRDFVKLSADFSKMATGLTHETELREIWSAFAKNVAQTSSTINVNNDKREVPYHAMHPDYLECAVSK